jgi:3-dehydroquinate synthase
MVMAADLSASLGLIPGTLAGRVARLVARAGLPTTAPQLPLARWFQLMSVDKKASDGDIRFVLLDGPGSATMRAAPQQLVEAVIHRHSAGSAAGT